MSVEMIPEMVSINEASKRTGLSYELIRQLCIRKQIVYIKSGRKYLINFGALCAFLNNGGISPNENCKILSEGT